MGLGAAVLGSLLPNKRAAASDAPHFAPKAKRVIFLFMAGAPSQLDLFDYKPVMNGWYDKELPDSVRMGQRLTTMTSTQERFPVAPSKYKFSRVGQCGMWMNTELLPRLATKVDEICWMRSLHTEAINHEPAIAAMQTGNEITGRPCLSFSAGWRIQVHGSSRLPVFTSIHLGIDDPPRQARLTSTTRRPPVYRSSFRWNIAGQCADVE